MFNAHFTYIVIVVDVEPPCKCAAFLALFGTFDIFVRCEVVHDERYPALVVDFAEACTFKFVDGDRSGDVVGQHHVEAGADELPWNN